MRLTDRIVGDMHTSRSCRLGVVLVLALAGVGLIGCAEDSVTITGPVPHDAALTDDEAAAALEVALDADEAGMRGSVEVIAIDRVAATDVVPGYIRVVLRGEIARRPRDECAIGGHSGDETGLVFYVSDPPATVAAVSPEWDESVSCLGETGPPPG